MRLPAIRYPLLWLLTIGLLVLVVPMARPTVESWLAKARKGVTRVVEGPPVPSSLDPQKLGDVLVRKGLLLREGLEALERPGGSLAEPIGQRMFVDFYDVWPPGQEPTHVRVGNRRPFGWIKTTDVLPWDTRLTVTPKQTSVKLASEPAGAGQGVPCEPGVPLPVVGWSEKTIQVAAWKLGRAWEAIDLKGWTPAPDLQPTLSPGAWLSRVELLALIRMLVTKPASGPGDEEIRIRALLGLLSAREALTDSEIRATREILPGWALSRGQTAGQSRERKLEALAELNISWEAQARWSGLEFRSVPLELLP